MKREEFLEIMDEMNGCRWSSPHYPIKKRGRPPIEIETMPRGRNSAVERIYLSVNILKRCLELERDSVKNAS